MDPLVPTSPPAILTLSALEKSSEKPCHPKGHCLPCYSIVSLMGPCVCANLGYLQPRAPGERVAQHSPQPAPLSAPGTNGERVTT